MYESGLSKSAKILFLIIAFLLGYIFIMASGCSCACANAAEAVVIQNADGAEHSFF